MSIERCEDYYECKGECWLNVGDRWNIWNVISQHCKGTLKEKELNDDIFSGKESIQELETIYNLTDEEKEILKKY